jgi:CubicO group peptidase (beta-lactamase class C family)
MTINRSFQMMIVCLSVVLTFFGIGVQPIFGAQSTDTELSEAIDSYVEEQMQRLKIPGLALAIVKDGQIEYMQAYGIAGADGRAATPQTPFLIGGLSKTFTALSLMQLAEAGRIDLDAPIQQYLPWFTVADREASSKMTIRHLLYHTAGFSEVGGYLRNLDPNMADDALEVSVRRLRAATLNNPPGSEYEFSNINYGILALLVETVSGQSYETYLQQNIFEPLDMQRSFTSQADAHSAGASSGYYPFFGVPIVFDNLMPYSRVIVPTGGLYSSAEDMAHYLIAQLNQGGYGSEAILSPQGMAELHRPGIEVNQRDSFAMGWWVVPFYDSIIHQTSNGTTNYSLDTAINFEGTWDGFHSFALMVPQEKVGVVVLMNANDPLKSSAYGLLGWYISALALGSEPSNYLPSENFFRQNARLILAAIILLLLAELVWTLRKLRSYRQDPQRVAPSRRRLLIFTLLLAVIDIGLVWYLLSMIPQQETTVGIVVRSSPDLGLLMALILLLTLGWGTVRTVLMLKEIFKQTGLDNPQIPSMSPEVQ